MIAFSEGLVVLGIACFVLGPKQWTAISKQVGAALAMCTKLHRLALTQWAQFLASQRLDAHQQQAMQAEQRYHQEREQ